ncbi:uncharacterized protein [Physcomitrium patens]|nr:uncharacterized protein LOC112292811 isoform X2 [Physcomitrium patens]PNR39445.1 hypothetical protein PHYPA_019723 [Physcomitrium patens]|eukprot:XP_024397413.1 uncharacterized protein LOC112292811 isoform X2 [Physcomitrella patens]
MHACERRRVVDMTMKDGDHVVEWNPGLPTGEELNPTSKSLISLVLASGLSMKPEPLKTAADVSGESRASFLDSQVQRFSPMSFEALPLFKERKDAGSFVCASEVRDDGGGRGDGHVGGRGGSIATGEGRSDARGEVRGETRGAEEPEIEAEVEVGLGLGLGSGGGGRDNDRATVAEKQNCCSHSASYSHGHGGHPMPTVFRGGSDGTSHQPSEGRSEHSSGLPFMMNGLPAYGSPYERRPDSSSYGGRGDDSSKGGGCAKNARKLADSDFEDTDSGGGPVNSNEETNARTLKRPRLVWTPQLHKRFVDAVGHLGIKNAVPKTIMQLMNVEGLTRENVASHLQKYRLYLKRMQGLSSDGPPANDQLFSSTPLPPNLGLHYMANQREDVGGPSFPPATVPPMPYKGVGGGPLGPAHFSVYDRMPYGVVNRGFLQRPPMKDRTEHISESENGNHQSVLSQNHHSYMEKRANSPEKRLLSLFPTSSR